MCTSLHYVSQRHQPSPKTWRSSSTEQLHSTAAVSLHCSIVNTSVRTVKSDTASPAYTRARPTRLCRTRQEPPINQPCVRKWNSRSLSHESPFLWDQSSHYARARTHTLACVYIYTCAVCKAELCLPLVAVKGMTNRAAAVRLMISLTGHFTKNILNDW